MNIFEKAYFGKPFKTRDGRKFVFLGEVESFFGHNSCIEGMIENEDTFTYYNSEGKSLYCEYKGSAINAFEIDFNQVNCEEDCETDIVSEWEEISKDELDRLASDYSLEYHNQNSKITVKVPDGVLFRDSIAIAFKAGYYKAVNIKMAELNSK